MGKKIKRVLMVDDEESAMADHRVFLRQAGVEVIATTRLDDALVKLKESFIGRSFDLVLLDLMLPGAPIPKELLPFFQKLERTMHNEGQALGQWLWEKEGANKILNRPKHCYFTSLNSLYAQCKFSERTNQEFMRNGQDLTPELHAHFVLNKARVRPSQLLATLEQVSSCWNTILSSPNQQLGGQNGIS